jgi:hypothetical protein
MFDPKRVGPKKNERIKQMVQKIETLKTEYDVPAVSLVTMTGFSTSSYQRWKRRLHRGESPVKKPGAKKIQPFDLGELKHRIRSLSHRRKRTAGTGQLYKTVKHGISRREFNDMVREVRYETNRQEAADRSQVFWLRPDLTWALDGLEYKNRHVQNLQDLCSRYKFVPMITDYLPNGEEVAGHLSRHFCRFGPPLFLKRDNGGNLNKFSINDLLEELMIIPINSPIYTASYNGAVERSQGELKGWLRKWNRETNTLREFELQVENAAHALNHKSRRSLYWKNSCRSYFCSSRLRYNKRKRKEAYDWIKDLAVDISDSAGKNKIDPAAWRVSAIKWMAKHRLITIRKPSKVLPNLSSKLCHN